MLFYVSDRLPPLVNSIDLHYYSICQDYPLMYSKYLWKGWTVMRPAFDHG